MTRVLARASIAVARPAEKVFAAVADLRGHGDWSPKPDRTEGLPEGAPVVPGTRNVSCGGLIGLAVTMEGIPGRARMRGRRKPQWVLVLKVGGEPACRVPWSSQPLRRARGYADVGHDHPGAATHVIELEEYFGGVRGGALVPLCRG